MLVAAVFATCSVKTSDTCTIESDCRYLNSCDSEGCCVHKDLMPLKGPEAGGTILVFVISGMSNAGGIGGGPIMTAFEILTFYFNTKQSIPLSQVIIAAGAVIGLTIRVLMRHPTKNRPLLEYHVSMLIIPPILFGSLFGVMVNKILPSVAILSMLTVVLIFITLMTLKNGIKLYKAETRTRKEKAEKGSNDKSPPQEPNICIPPDSDVIEGELIEKIPLNQGKDNPTDQPAMDSLPDRVNGEDRVEVATEKKEISAELVSIYKRESKQFPLIPWLWIIFIVAYVAVGLIIRGGSKGNSLAGIEYCGDGFKVFYAIWSLVLLLLTFVPFIYLIRLKKTYDSEGNDYDEYDIKWTAKGCTQVWVAGLAGGFLGSMLGFGASLLVAPILVQWRLRSAVIGPTAALMTLIGSAIAVMQYAIQKNLNGEYAGWLAMVALLGSLTGVLSITHLMKKLGRPSLLVLILAVVLGIAMVIVPVYLVLDAVKKELEGKPNYKLVEFCS